MDFWLSSTDIRGRGVRQNDRLKIFENSALLPSLSIRPAGLQEQRPLPVSSILAVGSRHPQPRGVAQSHQITAVIFRFKNTNSFFFACVGLAGLGQWHLLICRGNFRAAIAGAPARSLPLPLCRSRNSALRGKKKLSK